MSVGLGFTNKKEKDANVYSVIGSACGSVNISFNMKYSSGRCTLRRFLDLYSVYREIKIAMKEKMNE
ncbi:MAG: hypothetical protein SO231_08705 [Phocaeicola vulgatus]|nr:hypothetical protein [Phocaeicola vulgatus]